MWRASILAGCLLACWGRSNGQLTQNGTDPLEDEKLLPAKERFRRLIPYMNYYQFGGGSPVPQQAQSYLYQPSPLVPVGYLVGGGFRSVPVYSRPQPQPQPQRLQPDYSQLGYTPQRTDLSSVIAQNYLAIAKQTSRPKEPPPPQYAKSQFEEARPKTITYKPQKIYMQQRPVVPQRIAYSQPQWVKSFRPTYAPVPLKDDSYVQMHSNYDQSGNHKSFSPDPDVMTITKSQELTFAAQDPRSPIAAPIPTTKAPKIPVPTYYEPLPAVPELLPAVPSVPAIEHNSLLELITGYQLRKALPEKVTSANIGSSIQALSSILKLLQKYKADGESDAEVADSYGDIGESYSPTQTEASTPGRAGIDYPAYAEIPETRFSCKNQRYKGFFGDPDTNCQVWHYCDLNGGQASFLCPNGTIFSQSGLTCDWWYNVKCASTAQLYVLNERLYKYILPAKPSFPEDYAGPLVDQYLELKFREIEAKKNANSTAAKAPAKIPVVDVPIVLNEDVGQEIK